MAELLSPHRIVGQWHWPVQRLEDTVMRAAQELHQASLNSHRISNRRMKRYRSHRLPARIVLRLLHLKPRRIEESFSHDEAVAMYLDGLERQLARFEDKQEHEPYCTKLETATARCRELTERLREHLPSSTHEST